MVLNHSVFVEPGPAVLTAPGLEAPEDPHEINTHDADRLGGWGQWEPAPGDWVAG